MMKVVVFVFCLLGLMGSAMAGLPEPGALAKNGSCPADYVAKANECEPTKQARFAIAKSGNCPDNYAADGNYCLAEPDARLAIRRAAMTCPKGFTPIGDYCISNQ
jgi:hypothetical protein